MQEKKRQEKIKPATETEKTVAEILVANGRSIEPFIKVFNYSDDNVTKSSLGTLVGVFEVAEQSEDSAYIVNFLASVAKKEYFNNPRRGAIESFEAALHKINLALAELVKHGNIAWLGKLHGALGVLEKNNLHFSVTGAAQILLIRNGSVSEISEGLASPESHLHPIKTFVEVSSGRLTAHDKVIFTSPELFTLFSLADLEKNASRMEHDRFSQFLRTALINELNMAGALIIDLQERQASPVPKKQEEKPEKIISNVFSEQAFTAPEKMPAAAVREQENENPAPAPTEYIDSKTGHIYVQGETFGSVPAHPALERAQLTLEGVAHALGALFISQGKLWRKGKKQGLIFFSVLNEYGGIAVGATSRSLRRHWNKTFSAIQTKARTAILSRKRQNRDLPSRPPGEPAGQATAPVPAPTRMAPLYREEAASAIDGHTAPLPIALPPRRKEKLAAFYKKITGIKPDVTGTALGNESKLSLHSLRLVISVAAPLTSLEKYPYPLRILRTGYAAFRSVGITLMHALSALLKRGLALQRKLSERNQKIALALEALLIISLIGGAAFWMRSASQDTPAPRAEAPEQPLLSAFPLDTEKNARLLQEPLLLATQENRLTAPVLLDGELFLITANGILNVRENKEYGLPAAAGRADKAAVMEDLRLIFIFTENAQLFAWSPISHTFVTNTLSLPEGAHIQDIGAYLTYLYVLESGTDQIYRFPRAEGGFGEPVRWIKENPALEETARMAVNENIFLSPAKEAVQIWSRGRFVKNLESPHTTLSVTSLYTHPGLTNVYALDTANKRLLVWNQDGALIAQYFSEKLADGEAITVSEKNNEVFLTTSDSLLSFKLGN